MLRPVNLDPAIIGQPLPWDLYSESGVLLAGAGLLLADAAQFERLTTRALFREGDDSEATQGPLLRLAELAKQTAACLEHPEAQEIRTLARELLALQLVDGDACLGYACLMPLTRPSVSHALRVLFISGLLAESLEFSPEWRESLAAAALTMNLASLDLHDRFHHLAGHLTEVDRAALRGHPVVAADLLRGIGVDDAVWLEAVQQSHENLDGSGYPRGLSGSALSLSARLLRVADYYCAKIGGRHYRPPKAASFAYQELFGREKGRLDGQIATLLLRRVGLYPPGSLVRLASREVACVARRAGGGTLRWAVGVLDARGRALAPLQMRDVASRNHAIIGNAAREPGWPEIDWMTVWGYR